MLLLRFIKYTFLLIENFLEYKILVNSKNYSFYTLCQLVEEPQLEQPKN